MAEKFTGRVFIAPVGTGPITDWDTEGKPVTVNEDGITQWQDFGVGTIHMWDSDETQ